MKQETIDKMRGLVKQLLSLLGPETEPVVETPAQPAATPAPEPNEYRQLAWGKKVNQDFRDRVWWIADELTKFQGALFDANHLMACMAFESGESFSASKKNPASSATGLIQFMNSTAAELGTTTAKLAAMKDEDQLRYVYKYFVMQIQRHGAIRTLEDCYMAILWPNAVGKPSEYPLFVNDVQKLRDAYDVNKGLDKNKDNRITKAEAAAKVYEKLVKGLQSDLAA